MNKIEEAYLFETHSRSTIQRWNSCLKWFRFCRAHGGHVNDGDSFQASIQISDKVELLMIMDLLEVDLETLSPDNPEPMPGISYTAAEYEAFRFPIRDYPEFEQPGWRDVFGSPCYISVRNQVLDLQLSGAELTKFDVTERDFENARRIEEQLDGHGLKFVHPPRGCRCICEECS